MNSIFFKQAMCLVAVFSMFNGDLYSMQGNNNNLQPQPFPQLQIPADINELNPSIETMQELIARNVDVQNDPQGTNEFVQTAKETLGNAGNHLSNIIVIDESIKRYRKYFVQNNKAIEQLRKRIIELQSENNIINQSLIPYKAWAENNKNDFNEYRNTRNQLFQKINNIINQLNN